MKEENQMDGSRTASNVPGPDPSMENARKMTFGERLVGLTFNPSNDDKVGKAKQLFAQAADLLRDHFVSSNSGGGLEQAELASTLYTHAIGEILNAQMNVVKVLTLKY